MSRSARSRYYSYLAPKCVIINQLNSHNSQNRSERSGQVTVSRKEWQYSSWTEQRAANSLPGEQKGILEKLCLQPNYSAGIHGTQMLFLVDLRVNKFLLCSAFSTKTRVVCWQDQVSNLHLTSSPFNISIHTLSYKANTASVHQVHVSTASSLDTSLWLPHSCEWRTAGSDHPGQSHSFLFLCSMSHILHPSTEMLNAFQSLLPTHEPFSHAAADSSMYLLASDCWLTLSQPHWGCDSGLLLVARTHSHCEEHLKGILWTL